MSLVVQKYGGSSIADAEKLKNIARRIIRRKEEGDEVVVVVSAMGDTTERLLRFASQVSKCPNQRELDFLLSTGEIISSTLLAIALHDQGHNAVSLSGAQAGIRTDASYSRAYIRAINPQRILKELKKGNIVIVAGFQGMTGDMDITTLGRGGSDTTAVALAAKLGTAICEIYTDVSGVYTADPCIVPEARKLKEIDYEEMLELASYGAKVIHPRAVELGKVYNMPILVASSFTEETGTLIHEGISMEIQNKVRGIAHDLNVAKVTVVGVPDRPGISTSLFEPLAEAGISVDTIVQNASVEGITDLTFTINRSELGRVMDIIKPISLSIGAKDCIGDATLAKVSIVGIGMQNTPGYAARMFRTFYDAGINIEMITTSEIRITCIIKEEKVPDALRVLHSTFDLYED